MKGHLKTILIITQTILFVSCGNNETPKEKEQEVSKKAQENEYTDEDWRRDSVYQYSVIKEFPIVKKLKEYKNSSQYLRITQLKQKVINDLIDDYQLMGADLDNLQKEKLIILEKELKSLQLKFSRNILDDEAKIKWFFDFKEKDKLNGLSDRILDLAQQAAIEENKEGYLFRLSDGLDRELLGYIEDEEIRKKVWQESSKIAESEPFNNLEIIKKIIEIKYKISVLLGFNNPAEQILKKRMLKTTEEITSFLNEIGQKALNKAIDEQNQLADFTENKLKLNFANHNYLFAYNKYQKLVCGIDNEEIRKYFPTNFVIKKMFDLISDWFDLSFREKEQKNLWDNNVKVYDVYKNNQQIATIYIDLYGRSNKENGAWMDVAVNHSIEYINPQIEHKPENQDKIKEKKIPVSYLVADFQKGQDPTMSPEDVVVLFHEMGHTLHNLLTKVDEEFYAGINRVEWDGVEIPSQMLENFFWNKKIMQELSCHKEKLMSINHQDYANLKKLKNFFVSEVIIKMTRSSELDVAVFSQYLTDQDKNNILSASSKNIIDLAIDLPDPRKIENEIFDKWRINNLEKPYCRLATFSHIFDGGYAVGYYGYQWAEVMALDIYNTIIEKIDSPEEFKKAINKYSQEILAQGGTKSMLELFKNFSGRNPDIAYYLKHYEINKKDNKLSIK